MKFEANRIKVQKSSANIWVQYLKDTILVIVEWSERPSHQIGSKFCSKL